MEKLPGPGQSRLESCCASLGVVAFYAHGSYAQGRANTESDRDFAFLLNHGGNVERAMDALIPLLAELFDVKEGLIDLQDLRMAPPAFRLKVIETGSLLYCGDTYQLARFHACSVSEERDRQYFLRPFREAMRQRIREGRFAS